MKFTIEIIETETHLAALFQDGTDEQCQVMHPLGDPNEIAAKDNFFMQIGRTLQERVYPMFASQYLKSPLGQALVNPGWPQQASSNTTRENPPP